MGKLYKVILLFVGLIAMNSSVQAQLDVFSPYFLASHTNMDLLAISDEFTDPFDKEVTNFTNYPNPVTTSTTIAYTLSTRATVNLRVVDLTGKQLAVLVKQEQAAGKQEYFWELSKNNITSGMYILVLQVENKVYSRKIIVQ